MPFRDDLDELRKAYDEIDDLPEAATQPQSQPQSSTNPDYLTKAQFEEYMEGFLNKAQRPTGPVDDEDEDDDEDYEESEDNEHEEPDGDETPTRKSFESYGVPVIDFECPNCHSQHEIVSTGDSMEIIKDSNRVIKSLELRLRKYDVILDALVKGQTATVRMVKSFMETKGQPIDKSLGMFPELNQMPFGAPAGITMPMQNSIAGMANSVLSDAGSDMNSIELSREQISDFMTKAFEAGEVSTQECNFAELAPETSQLWQNPNILKAYRKHGLRK